MTTNVSPDFRARSLAFRAGVIVIVVLAAVLFLTFKAQTGMPFARTTEVQAQIANVHSLRVNDLVRQNSKRIGRVSKIEYADGAALVTMSIEGDAKVYRNAHVSILDLSALATKFVDLDPGTRDAGPLAGPIPASQADDSTDLYQILDVFDLQTRDGATAALRQVGGGLAGHGGDLHDFVDTAPDVLQDLGTVSETLSSREADLPTLLENVDRLSSRFAGRQTELARLVAQAGETLDGVAVDSGARLEETIARLPGTLGRVDNAMTNLHVPLRETGAALRALRPGAEALGKSENNLRGFLRDSVPVARKVPAVAGQAIPAVEDLAETLADARPLAAQVQTALADLLPPLSYLAPYATDMQQLFTRGRSFVSQGPRPGVRYARLGVTPGVNTLTGGLLSSGNLPQNEYPRPGEAQHDRADGLLPTGLLPGGANR